MPDHAPVAVGTVYGKLTVIRDLGIVRRSDHVKRSKHYAVVRCECGTEKEVQVATLRRGTTRSCGSANCKQYYAGKHGAYDTPEYSIWIRMRQRCNSPADKRYSDYGGRGITVDPRWNDFANFIEDMGPRPSPLLSLERKDNDGPYSKDNCIWASNAEQSRNKRNNHWIEYNGKRMVLQDWANELGIEQSVLIRRLGTMPLDLAMTKEVTLIKTAMVGVVYGKLTVIEDLGMLPGKGRRNHYVLVRCECGRELTVLHSSLTSGNTNSCGKDPCRFRYTRETKQKAGSRTVTFNGETMSVFAWAERLGLTYNGLRLRLEHMTVEQALTTPKGVRAKPQATQAKPDTCPARISE